MYGDMDYFEKSTKMLANTLYFIKGTPLFIKVKKLV